MQTPKKPSTKLLGNSCSPGYSTGDVAHTQAAKSLESPPCFFLSLLVLLFNSNDFWRKNNLNHLKRSNNSGRRRAIDELVDWWRFHVRIYIFIQITVAKYSLWQTLGLPRLRLQSGFQECCDHSTQCIIHTYHIDSHCIDHTKVTSILHIHKCTTCCSLKICCHSLCHLKCLLEFHYIQRFNFTTISSCAKVEGGNACLGCQHEVFLLPLTIGKRSCTVVIVYIYIYVNI